MEAPILTNSDCEGGSSVFRVESAEHFSNASPPHQSHIKSFFHSPTYLTVSSQLYLEAISASISRVYTLGPAFRAEPSLTSRHLSEFWMLEQEIAFVDSIDQILDIVEGCVRAAWATASERLPEDLRKLHQSETLPVVPEHWPRINYDQAVDLLRTHHAPVTWGSDLSTEQERWITDQHYKSPVFVTDYPASLKPFYMRKNDQPSPHGSTAACFDLLVPGIGELAGGSLREERLPQLRQAMREKQLHEQDYDWYLDLRRYGSVPHGGFGLGWERLTSWITGLENVRECIAFPRAKEGFEI